MDTKETRKRIEFRANLKIVRTPELKPVRKVSENDEKTELTDKVSRPLLPKEPSGYIKSKKHDFF